MWVLSSRTALLCLLCVLGVALSCSQSPDTPSLQCQVCEDVMQTYHDAYPCAGHSDDWGSPLDESISACQQPLFSCDMLDPHERDACETIELDMALNAVYARAIWEGMMTSGDAYQVCTELGKCRDTESDTDALACRQVLGRGDACEFDPLCAESRDVCDPTCRSCFWLVHDWPLFEEVCKPAGAEIPGEIPESALEDPEDPAPPSQTTADPTTTTPSPTSFLSMQTQVSSSHVGKASGSRTARLSQKFASLLAKYGHGTEGKRRTPNIQHLRVQTALEGIGDLLGSSAPSHTPTHTRHTAPQEHTGALLAVASTSGQVPAAGKTGTEAGENKPAPPAAQPDGSESEATVTPAQADNLAKECVDMWHWLTHSTKGRFFAQWKRYLSVAETVEDRMEGRAWDAHVACQCAGRCELAPFEDLELDAVCAFNEMDQLLMNYLADNTRRRVPA